MSTQTPTQSRDSEDAGLLFILAQGLAPLFRTITSDLDLARGMALTAIESYQPKNRWEYVSVARMLALSMTAITLLGKIPVQTLTLEETLQTTGRANDLNRSANQTERILMQRRRHHDSAQKLARAQASEPPPATRPIAAAEAPKANPDPEDQMSDAEVAAVLDTAMKAYQSAIAPGPAQGATPQRHPTHRQTLMRTSAIYQQPASRPAA